MSRNGTQIWATGLILTLAVWRSAEAGESRFLQDCLATDASPRLRIEACTFAMQVEQLPDGQKARALARRASGYVDQSLHQLAMTDISDARKLAPDDPDIAAEFADISHFVGGNQDAAIVTYETLLSKTPNDINTLMKLGDAYMIKGDDERAMATFAKIIEIEPNNVRALLSHSGYLVRKLEFDAGLIELDRVIALEPKNAMAYDSRGMAELGAGKYDLAIADFDFAIKTEPQFVQRRFRGAAKYAIGDFSGAVADFEFEMDHTPDMERLLVWRYLAEKRTGGGNVDELLAMAGKLEGRWPADLLLFAAGQKNIDQILLSAKSKNPKMQRIRESQAHFTIAELALLAGDKEIAKAHFQQSQEGGLLMAQDPPTADHPGGLIDDDGIEYSLARERLRELSQ